MNSRLMNEAEIRTVFATFAAANPAPRTELHYQSPFQLLIAVMLSAQATDKSVNRVTARLFADAPDAAAMFALGEEKLQSYIQSIGLYRSKARHIIASCALLLEQHGGEVPHQRAALEALPGVGRKTANVVLNAAFGEATIAVDTHIFRLANRSGLAPGSNVRQVEEGLMRRVPPEYLPNAHHWLVLHGRYVCKARRPECWRCPIRSSCHYPDKNHEPHS